MIEYSQCFAAYCQPFKNVPFERYRFYSRMQEAGESYDHYRTVSRQLADRCEFETITADQMLRDKLVFGIQDSKIRERLLREKNLSLQKTDEICRAHETTIEQMKVVGGASTGDTDSGDVNAFSKKPKGGKKRRGRFPRGCDSRRKACVIAGVRMMCQSVKTVQHLEKGVTSVTSKTISQTCVLDQCLSRRSEEIESIIWRMNFQTKFLAWRFQRWLLMIRTW